MSKSPNERRRRGPGLIERLCLRLSTSEHIDGLWVGTLEGKPELVLRRVREALRLIKVHDQLRYERIVRDIKRVWVTGIQSPTASFDRRLDACMLNRNFVLAESSTPEAIAAAVVHEATHARLFRCGIGYDEKLRARVEAACIRRELAFSAKIPNGESVRTRAENKLISYCNDAYLTDLAIDKRHTDQATIELRQSGVPDWIVQMVLVLRPGVRAIGRLGRHSRKILANLGSAS